MMTRDQIQRLLDFCQAQTDWQGEPGSRLKEDAIDICEAALAEPEGEPSTVLRLIDTIKYLVGIAERGEGRKARDDELPEQFVLGYVKRLEAALAEPSEPVYWQWRRKDKPWANEYIFAMELQATTDDSEVRKLFTHPASKPLEFDKDFCQAIAERDEYHDMADKLAEGIALHFDGDIGEHSSSNSPWDRALDLLDSAACAETMRLTRPAKPEPSEPVGWQLGHRFYTSLKDAEYAWRNDCAFLGTSYVPEPLFTRPASKPEPSEPDCSPNHLCNGRMVHLPNGEQCDKCGETP